MSVETTQKLQKAAVETVVIFMKATFLFVCFVLTGFALSIAMAITA